MIEIDKLNTKALYSQASDGNIKYDIGNDIQTVAARLNIVIDEVNKINKLLHKYGLID